jgi:hypothetical protein
MIVQALAAAAALALPAAPATPVQNDPMGPISDVTRDWQSYQPADTFCVKPDVNEYAAGGIGPTTTGADPACAQSGFSPTTSGLVKIHVDTPTLCTGCRRLFIDFSKVPAANGAHGHAYYHLASVNPGYTVDPVDHSPNTKDFTNDKLVAPDGSPQAAVAQAFELHAIDFVTDTAHFVHTGSQGPYYIGSWYLSRDGRRIEGVYLDVDTADATPLPGGAAANGIYYMAGYNSGAACPNDDDILYAGCADSSGGSAEQVVP